MPILLSYFVHVRFDESLAKCMQACFRKFYVRSKPFIELRRTIVDVELYYRVLFRFFLPTVLYTSLRYCNVFGFANVCTSMYYIFGFFFQRFRILPFDIAMFLASLICVHLYYIFVQWYAYGISVPRSHCPPEHKYFSIWACNMQK
jgi:hypothetical protein